MDKQNNKGFWDFASEHWFLTFLGFLVVGDLVKETRDKCLEYLKDKDDKHEVGETIRTIFS